MKLTIAIAQINIVLGEPRINEEKISDFTEKAAVAGADVIVYPEMWNTGYALDKLQTLADKEGVMSQDLLSRLANKYHINIVGGSVAIKQHTDFYNTMYIYNRLGQKISQYNKVHLFGLMSEGQYLTSGSQKTSFMVDDIPSTGVICYDIRFPEWIRTLMSDGPKQLLFVASEWPVQRIQQWQILLQARAVENQTFVIAANRVGKDQQNTFGGSSMIIDPLGNIIARGSSQNEELVLATVDTADEQAVRGEIPVFNDRRIELY